MVARKHLNVMLHAHCRSCLIKPYLRNMFLENLWLRRKIFLVFKAVYIQVMLCRFMETCNLMNVYECFWETWFFHLQNRNHCIRNVRVYVGNCKRFTDCGMETFLNYGKLRIGTWIIGQISTVESQDIMPLKHMDT